MISFQRAQRILSQLSLSGIPCRLDLAKSYRAVLAADVRAAEDSPSFSRSLMDGFAVCARDTRRSLPLRILGFTPAGRAPLWRVRRGACVRIATGAPVPSGADAVIKVEDTFFSGGRLVCGVPVCKGENITPKGTYFRKGARLLARGTRLEAASIALLASQGVRRVSVYKRPRVAVLATGDEIIESGRKKTAAQIWNASTPMLVSALTSLGVTPVYLGCVRDDAAAAGRLLRQGLTYDVFIVTGAVSMGERDFVPGALRRLGVEPLFHKVRIRPGKPVFLGRRSRCIVFGLPGNAVSSLVTFFLFVRPVLERLQGLDGRTVFEEGVLAGPAGNASGRLSFLPGRLKRQAGRDRIMPLCFHDSSDLRSAAAADVFYCLRESQVKAARGTRVPFFRIPR